MDAATRWLGECLSPEQWRVVTRLGESQIVLPAMAAVLLWLWWMADRRLLALRWLTATTLVVLLVTASKVAFFGYELGYAPWNYTGLSGHAAVACTVLPVLAVLCASGAARATLLGVWGLAVVLASVIAISRVPVGAHSWSEVAAGALTGLAGSSLTLRGAWRGSGLPQQRIAWWLPVAVAGWLVVTPVNAPPSPTHGWVLRLSVAVSGRTQPYSRQEMRRRWYAEQRHRSGLQQP